MVARSKAARCSTGGGLCNLVCKQIHLSRLVGSKLVPAVLTRLPGQHQLIFLSDSSGPGADMQHGKGACHQNSAPCGWGGPLGCAAPQAARLAGAARGRPLHCSTICRSHPNQSRLHGTRRPQGAILAAACAALCCLLPLLRQPVGGGARLQARQVAVESFRACGFPSSCAAFGVRTQPPARLKPRSLACGEPERREAV